jgi:aryl-alcohol dehydrogenase-like predicted oxidoreductase
LRPEPLRGGERNRSPRLILFVASDHAAIEAKPMEQRQLGNTGPTVSALGLGCMGMSDLYGPADRQEGIATIRTALDAGITLLDTADYYGMGHNELLIGEAIQGRRREDVLLSVRFGALRGPDGEWLGLDGRPASVKAYCAYSLRRLGTDYIDIYLPARLDPGVPIEDTVGAIAELVEAGYVRYIGLSEVGAETLHRASAVQSICNLQIEYSVLSRGIEAKILPACRELGIGITAYGVLARGLMSGHWTRDRQAGPSDFRTEGPRFLGENLEYNLRLVEVLRQIANIKDASVAQIAIAWTLARGDDIVPLIGARRREHLDEALGALRLKLSPEDVEVIDRAIPPGAVHGERYAPAQMDWLDSER